MRYLFIAERALAQLFAEIILLRLSNTKSELGRSCVCASHHWQVTLWKPKRGSKHVLKRTE